MAAFALHQLDYILFVYGLSLLCLAAIGFYLCRSIETTVAWRWLGVCGLTHGLYEWLQCIESMFGSGLVLQWLQYGLLAASYLCLCEFGRRTIPIRPTMLDWRWCYMVLLVVSGMGAIWGFDGLTATTRLSLGFGGCASAGAAMFRIAKRPNQLGGRSLRMAGVLFLACGVSVVWGVPRLPFFPANCINQEAFLNVVGFPPELLKAVLATAMLFCLWYYMLATQAGSAKTLGPGKPSIFIRGFACGMIVSVLVGWIFAEGIGNHAEREFNEWLRAGFAGADSEAILDAARHTHIAEHRIAVLGLTSCAVAVLTAGLLVVQRFREIGDEGVTTEHLYRRLFNTSPNRIQLLDMQGRCLAVSPSGLHKLGRSKFEMLGTDYLDTWPREAKAIAAEALAKAAQGQIAEFEAPYIRPDGKTLVWHVVLNLIADSQGESRRIVEIAVDVTERCRTEMELRRAKDAAEAASVAKGRFVANISHEIRTPITAVLGYADLLSEPDLSVEDRAAHLHTIRRNGEILLELINDVLDLSRMEHDQLEIRRVHCSPWQVLADVYTLFWPQAAAKGVALAMECDGPLPETIFTDPARLRRILVNLVGNAVKFTKAGEVRVIARIVRNGSHAPAIQYDIVDTGIGMTKSQLEMGFGTFTQVDASMSREFGGAGLGLPISKRLAALLDGNLTAESQPQKGSKFQLTVATGPLDGAPMREHARMATRAQMGALHAANKPFAAPPLGETGARSRPQSELACAPSYPAIGGRILLAEDGSDNQRLLSLILKKASAEVDLAQNGKEAVEKAIAGIGAPSENAGANRRPFDLVLMDLQMPVLDGLDATRRLRQEGYEGPIIALSAHTMSEAVEKCLAAGCTDYLTKPINRAELLRKLAKYLAPPASVVETDAAPPKLAS